MLLPEKREATAELSIVYNKIIIFSRQSEALLKDHTGTRMQHRQQEVDLWDFPCEEIAWEGWVSWRFYLKTSSGSVPPQQAGFVTPEQLPLCLHTSLSRHLSLQGHTKSQDRELWRTSPLQSRRTSAWSGTQCLPIPFCDREKQGALVHRPFPIAGFGLE